MVQADHVTPNLILGMWEQMNITFPGYCQWPASHLSVGKSQTVDQLTIHESSCFSFLAASAFYISSLELYVNHSLFSINLNFPVQDHEPPACSGQIEGRQNA